MDDIEGGPTGRVTHLHAEMQELRPRTAVVAGSNAQLAMYALAAMDYSGLELRIISSMNEPRIPHLFETDKLEITPGIPNHVNVDEWSPYHWPHFRNLGVKIDGEERKGDVHEFNVAEGWAMVRRKNGIGQFMIDPDNTRRFLLERVQGKIEPYLKKPLPLPKGQDQGDTARLEAAAAKRARKAEKLSRG